LGPVSGEAVQVPETHIISWHGSWLAGQLQLSVVAEDEVGATVEEVTLEEDETAEVAEEDETAEVPAEVVVEAAEVPAEVEDVVVVEDVRAVVDVVVVVDGAPT